MFSEKHYVPAVRWRQGEYGALEELHSQHRRYITPLVDIPPLPWDFAEERPSKTIDQHLARIPDQMVKAWGVANTIFIDLGLVDSNERMSSGRHPVDELFESLDAENIHAIPVVATDRDPDYIASVRTVMRRDGRGVCIRASLDDMADAASMEAIDDLCVDLEVDLDKVDLILDFRSIDASQVGLLRTLIGSLLRYIPDVDQFRTLTLLSGAFPINLSAISPGMALIPRADWSLWLAIRGLSLPRQPSYGDYTASHPDQQELDPRIMQASASVRYAGDTDWVIARGRSVRSPRFGGFAQYRALSASLMSHPMFTGRNFSWASDFIEQCAGGGNTGNLSTWRKVATNRHMARVAHQIANLP